MLAAIIIVNAYVIIAPFYPSINYWYQNHFSDTRTQLTQQISSFGKAQNNVGIATKASAMQGNWLIIPSMLLKQPIYEGTVSQTYTVLDKGIWHWPNGSTPDQGGNTILIGHRFTYTNPRGVFYELNQLKLGDQIGVWWAGKQYTYMVSSISVVSPSDTAILSQTKQPELTLYTCTPLWNPKERLIVVAQQESISS